MLNALKKLDKKFLILIGMIFILPILIIVFLAVVQGCGGKKIGYEAYEKKMISSFEKYLEETDKVPEEEGGFATIKLSTLINKGYIKSTESLIGDDSCNGSVSVRRNGSSIDANEGGFLNYTVDLQCDEYSTVKLVDKLKEDIVLEEDGLYVDGENYIFKGKNVNNYVTFFGHSYRIMGIDKNGILKLIKTDPELNNRAWDKKFNVDTNSSSGKNIYKDSAILEYLLSDYSNAKKVSNEAKKQIVAYDACIGKRSNSNYLMDSSIDCSEILEKQLISLPNVTDYAKASLDKDCVDLRSRSCNNYNYLYGLVVSTWTLNASSDNTYEVMYLLNGQMEPQSAHIYNEYNIVIYVDGNQKYISGEGSQNNPFIIE